MAHLIVGLGNPGKAYERTRHNLGFRVVRAFALKYALAFKKKARWQAEVAEGVADGLPVILLLPQTYMNLSGTSIVEAVRSSGIDLAKLMVVADDTDLPFGKVRMRINSGPGGHNGLKSVEESLQTNRYARMRIGVGAPEVGSLEDYVLGRFLPEEEETLPQIVERAVFGLEVWLKQGITRAMDALSRSSNPSNGEIK